MARLCLALVVLLSMALDPQRLRPVPALTRAAPVARTTQTSAASSARPASSGAWTATTEGSSSGSSGLLDPSPRPRPFRIPGRASDDGAAGHRAAGVPASACPCTQSMNDLAGGRSAFRDAAGPAETEGIWGRARLHAGAGPTMHARLRERGRSVSKTTPYRRLQRAQRTRHDRRGHVHDRAPLRRTAPSPPRPLSTSQAWVQKPHAPRGLHQPGPRRLVESPDGRKQDAGLRVSARPRRGRQAHDEGRSPGMRTTGGAAWTTASRATVVQLLHGPMSGSRAADEATAGPRPRARRPRSPACRPAAEDAGLG